MNMLRLSLLVLLVVALPMACKQEERATSTGVSERSGERAEVRRTVRQLAAAKTMRENPADEARYEEAKQELILRGSGIQSILFEELAATDDWGIRYGIVHVLSAVGTQRMVEPLIALLDDPEPRVAWMSMQVLRVVCNHQVVPLTEDDDAPVPPIPGLDGDAETQESMWRQWHAIHGRALRDAWDAWWRANRNRVRIN